MQIPLMPEIETLDKVDKGEVEPLAKELNGMMDDLDKRMQISFFNQAYKL